MHVLGLLACLAHSVHGFITRFRSRCFQRLHEDCYIAQHSGSVALNARVSAGSKGLQSNVGFGISSSLKAFAELLAAHHTLTAYNWCPVTQTIGSCPKRILRLYDRRSSVVLMKTSNDLEEEEQEEVEVTRSLDHEHVTGASLKKEKHTSAFGAVDPVEWNSWSESRMMEFMADIWQQKPLLVRGAFSNLREEPLLPSEAVLQLSSEDDIMSRMVLSARTVKDGPFTEKFLREQKNWTILVNDMERIVPELNDLLNNFKCIPTWRFGDVMVSVAPDGAGIGAHVDSYDVFLLQGSGIREWSISAGLMSLEEEEKRLTAKQEMRVLKDWSPTHQWVMEPGDMLYLPPRVPHCGVSKSDDCTTISVGFMMPFEMEALTYFSDFVAENCLQDGKVLLGRPSDADGGSQISSDVMASAKEFILTSVSNALNDEEKFSQWFGTFVTRPQRLSALSDWSVAESKESAVQFCQILNELREDPELKLVHASGVKCAHVLFNKSTSESDDGGWLFADGKCIKFSSELRDTIPQLTARGASLPSEFVLNAKPAMLDLLRKLTSVGVFELDY